MLKTSIVILIIALFIAAGYFLPERIVIPVQGATTADWNENTFWYEPWGESGVHKGIDIFGKRGTDVISAVDGIVVYTGQMGKGGNVVIVLGPKWRFHYYAHLDSIIASHLDYVESGEPIGKLGDSGNAKGRPPHLHYAIIRMIPEPWQADDSTQGGRKAYFIDPNLFLRG